MGVIEKLVRRRLTSLEKPHPTTVSVSETLVYTVTELETLLKLSRNHVYELIRRGALRKLSGTHRVLVSRRALDDYLAGRADPQIWESS